MSRTHLLVVAAIALGLTASGPANAHNRIRTGRSA